MRNYSEIGCLTLLGVTLTVYMTVGSCRPEEVTLETPRKNIIVESADKTVKLSGSGKHYFLKVSPVPVLSELVYSSRSIDEGVEAKSLPFFLLYYQAALFSPSDCRLLVESSLLKGTFIEECPFKNPLLSFAGEIRAGPLA